MGRKDLLAGILIILGAVALAEAIKPKCPICKNTINDNDKFCKYCGAHLRWMP